MIKKRIFEDKNYSAVWHDGKTIRIALDPKKPILELDYPEFYDVSINNFCTANCPWCLTDDSIINMTDGTKRITDVIIGDNIITFDCEKSIKNSNCVDQVHKRKYCGNLIIIELEDGSKIKLTPDHKIYTINRGFIEAKDISEFDDIYTIYN